MSLCEESSPSEEQNASGDQIRVSEMTFPEDERTGFPFLNSAHPYQGSRWSLPNGAAASSSQAQEEVPAGLAAQGYAAAPIPDAVASPCG